jgi:hypothetical protein
MLQLSAKDFIDYPKKYFSYFQYPVILTTPNQWDYLYKN